MSRVALSLLALVACKGAGPPGSSARPARTTPECATQDCETGEMIDNGCTPDGQCKSCVNFCEPKKSSAR